VLRQFQESQHPDLNHSAPWGSKCRAVLNATTGMFMHYLLSKENRKHADAFFEALASGEHLTKGEPVHTLRERLLRDRRRYKQQQHSGTQAFTCALIIKTWNAYRTQDGYDGGKFNLVYSPLKESYPKIGKQKGKKP
jgi:hypothetical protein